MSKYTLAKKAYKINFNRIDEGYLASEQICYENSIGKAKSKLLRNIRYDDLKLKYSNDNINFLNIPVIRFKEADLYHFEDKIISIRAIKGILEERTRIKELDEILLNETIKYCYIKKRGSYYRPNSCGYTDYLAWAGVYSKEEAVSHAKSCDELVIIPISIENHNKVINETIADLTTRLLS
jgi:hypothetical protein